MLMMVSHVPIARALDFLKFRRVPDAASHLRMASVLKVSPLEL